MVDGVGVGEELASGVAGVAEEDEDTIGAETDTTALDCNDDSESPLSVKVAVLVTEPTGALAAIRTGTEIVPILGFTKPPVGGWKVQTTVSEETEQAALDPAGKPDPTSVTGPLMVTYCGIGSLSTTLEFT